MSMSSPASADSSDRPPATPVEEDGSISGDVKGDVKAEPLREHFQALLPLLQQEWPQIAREHLEATQGRLEELVHLIASRTSGTRTVVRAQLGELIDHMGRIKARPKPWDEVLHPIEEQLNTLIEELRHDLGPRLKSGVQQQPLLSLAVALLAGLVTGLLLGSSRRQS